MSNNIGMRIGVIEYYRIRRMSREQQGKLYASMGVVLTLVMSILVLGSTTYAPSNCTHGVFLWPFIAIGLFLMVVFILGLCGGKNNNEGLFACYLLGLFIAILALLGFVIFGYIAIGKGIDLGDVKARDYNLEDYKSGWLRARVADPEYWATTSACLRDRGVRCKGLKHWVRDPHTGVFVPELPKPDWWRMMRHRDDWQVMLPMESSECCKPPSSCRFTYVNGTTWTPTPAAGAPAAATNNVDCSRWSNDQQKLCFQCDSGKAGFLDDTRKAWSFAAFFVVFGLMGAITSCWTGFYFF